MPSKPVAASSGNACDTPSAHGRGRARSGRRVGEKEQRDAALRRSSARRTRRRWPRDRTLGTSQNAAASTPSTAPAVLPAYSVAIDSRRAPARARARSIAGSVAPIAAVAGSSSSERAAERDGPVPRGDGLRADRPRAARARRARATARAPGSTTPITASHAANQRAGAGVACDFAPSSNAPSARPPKNAATTASTAADSWPSQSAACCVQTIW